LLLHKKIERCLQILKSSAPLLNGIKFRSMSLETLHGRTDGRTDRQTDRQTDEETSKEKRTDRRKDRYGEVSRCIPSTFAAQAADTTNLKNQIILGFGRRNPRHCAAVRGQITQLPVNRSLALSNRESRPQPASCLAAAHP
jgi:hypothetical protein